MIVLGAIVIGVLYAAGLYMMLRRSIIKLLIGLSLIGNAANLLIFSSSRLVKGEPALVAKGSTVPPERYSDPLAQGLILTAIVIGFAVIAFALVLSHRVSELLDNDDLDALADEE